MSNIKESTIFKIITLGESGVGKTSIIRRFLFNVYDPNSITTVGVSFSYKELKINNKETIKIKLIDTAGREKYRSLAKTYFKNAEGVFFVYSKNDINSFECIKEWIKLFKENHGNEDLPKYLVQNKDDLKDGEDTVDPNLGQDFAKKNDLIWIKTSAKDNIQIEELFQSIGEQLYKKYISNKKNSKQSGFVLSKHKKEKHSCCLLTSQVDD